MRVGIFDPYLDTLGGGEKYILDIASCFAQDNEVFIFWDDVSIKKQWEKRFNIDFSGINVTKNIFSKKSNLLKRFFQTKDYDLIIYMSDGSIPFLFGKKNILIFQFPVLCMHGKSILNKLKLKRISEVICYSDFVKSFIDKQYGFRSKIVSPCVDFPVEERLNKENMILTVGRFTKGMNAKKQEILIDEFKKLYDHGLSAWKLVLIGSYLPKDEDLVEKIKSKIQKYPIILLANVSYDELLNHYQKAKIYWHAAGFGEDLNLHPERAEHFGISTVEAMSHGAVPVVFNGGGQKEIVKEEENGYLWITNEELEAKTRKLIENSKLLEEMSKKARKRSQKYNKIEFCKKIKEII